MRQKLDAIFLVPNVEKYQRKKEVNALQILSIENGLPLLDGKPIEGMVSFELSADNTGTAVFAPKIAVKLRNPQAGFYCSGDNSRSNT